MVAIGMAFLLVMLWAGYLWYKKQLFENRMFLRTLVVLQPMGFIAVLMGWTTAEVGRQPWVVYGLMRTAEGVSPIAAGNVVWSMTFFIFFIGLLGFSYFYYTLRILSNGPDMSSAIPPLQRPSGMRPVDQALKEV